MLPNSDSPPAPQCWMPFEFVAIAARQGLAEFQSEFSELFFLLVRLPEPSGPLAVALQRASTLPTSEAAPPDEISHTTVYCSTKDLRADSEAAGHITAEMTSQPHFIVPVRRRKWHEAEGRDRIWVGRSPNNDLVLRHRTVSKCHAWLVYDDERRLFVRDARSRNATRVNGEPIGEEAVNLHPGDHLGFGSVKAMVSSPEALWQVLARL